jgi:surfactin synthase thioesterase subunit
MGAACNERPWLVRFGRAPAGSTRLFCFPCAGGAASMFRQMREPPWPPVEILAVQYPGREGRIREPPFNQLEPLVHAVADALEPHLDRRYALLGHSLGGLVAFELARELRRRRRPEPSRLWVAACGAPEAHRSRTQDRSDAELLELIRTLGATPESVLDHPELVNILLPAMRADFRILDSYCYRVEDPLGFPIDCLGGEGDTRVSRHALDEWRGQTRGEFSLTMFAGGHFFLQTAWPAVCQTLAARF